MDLISEEEVVAAAVEDMEAVVVGVKFSYFLEISIFSKNLQVFV